MNEARRLLLREELTRLSHAYASVGRVRERESTAFDNLPEGLKSSAKGAEAQHTLQWLSKCLASISSAVVALRVAIGD